MGGRLFMREGHLVLWSMSDPRPDGLLVVECAYFEGDGVVFVEEQSYTGTATVTAPISGSPTARRSRMCPRSSTAASLPHVACPRLLFTATKWSQT